MTRKRIVWTNEMINAIKSYSLPDNDIVKMYGISKNSIYKKRLELKCRYNNYKWSDEMIEILKNVNLSDNDCRVELIKISNDKLINCGAIKDMRNHLDITNYKYSKEVSIKINDYHTNSSVINIFGDETKLYKFNICNLHI